jgi:hypothetical protein
MQLNEIVRGQRSAKAIGYAAALKEVRKAATRYERLVQQGKSAVQSACANDDELAEIRELNEFFIQKKELLPTDVEHNCAGCQR